METTEGKVRAFLARHFSYELQPDENIFALGFVNSLFAMQLVLFVEREFGINVENDDLSIDNFKTVNAIVALVDRKLGAAVAS